MKKLINDPANVITDVLRGLAAAHPELRVDHEHRIVCRARRAGRARSAYLRRRLGARAAARRLRRAGHARRGLAGEIFTSPVPDQMVAATKAVDGGAGVLHIVKNYTGDVMNFEMAAELAQAEPGSRSPPWSPTTTCGAGQPLHGGPPGVGVTVLPEKIAGVAAEQAIRTEPRNDRKKKPWRRIA